MRKKRITPNKDRKTTRAPNGENYGEYQEFISLSERVKEICSLWIPRHKGRLEQDG